MYFFIFDALFPFFESSLYMVSDTLGGDCRFPKKTEYIKQREVNNKTLEQYTKKFWTNFVYQSSEVSVAYYSEV